ncbi:MAG: 3-dehydroquinate synthase [Chloroflexi bacterium]|nr:3-dehydroquinate synthase [Chloroflexota bacterium]
MGETAPERIALIGFSFSGKSSVGRELARRLGWSLVDTDDEIIRLAGKPIYRIFAEEGEEHFREMERRVLRDAYSKEKRVIATGGGAVLDPDNRELMVRSGAVIRLEARPETIHRRLLEHADDPGSLARPLLAGPDPLARIEAIKETRLPYYTIADWTVHTDNLTPTEVCHEVVHGWEYARRRFLKEEAVTSLKLPNAVESSSPYCQEAGATCVVATATQTYPVFIDWGILRDLGGRMRNAGLSGAASLISDDIVYGFQGAKALSSLKEAGFSVESFVVPAGETTKSLETATRIFDWLVERRIERGNPVVALGGGMIGDLAGFVAATYLRGLPLVQTPTSLLAMVDAAVGGKVAINLPQAKNLVGAFYQPRLVLMDVETLGTLPRRELISGWSEVVKHALIMDADLFDFMQANADGLMKLEPKVTTEAIRRSASLKAAVVSEDEKETGKRITLNYGHTIGHALEAVTGYGELLHGEAVAIGMMGAAMISRALGLIGSEVVDRQRALLQRLGLPVAVRKVPVNAVMVAMTLDKKVRGKAIRWVLLSDLGQAVVRNDVPEELVVQVLSELLES